ncbi:uncharacterized protein BKCO1_3000096 [Diplodia corticola]|uniref:Uncharacterized protein n=1 Tax=Diplodia corticola TaxID=236234 RepID=A0A1J9S171_9PEZI|nr:uncharacterized protein BKCO1_3000096 [Diplodia corticola]OJD33413.1 hypothetical protein BKCO1_3000096 [Diplodia corticola]
MWREATADLQLPPSLLQQPLVRGVVGAAYHHYGASSSSSSSSGGPSATSPSRSPIDHAYLPSPYDVQHARLVLVRGLGLPVELVDLVIDAAQYWPAVVGTTEAVGAVSLRSGTGGGSSSGGGASGGGGAGAGAGERRGSRGPVGINFGGSGVVRASDTRRNKAAQLVVVTGAVPGDGEVLPGGGRGKGWEGLRKLTPLTPPTLGSYHGSSSWFDACILRPLPASTPRPPLAADVASRIEQLHQRFGPPASEPFPTFLVGNLLSHDPEDARDFLRSLGWDFVERVERVEVDGEVGERRGVLWKVQTNVVASTDYHVHEGEWRRSNEHYWEARGEEGGEGEAEAEGAAVETGCGDGLGFVDEMKVGDRVGIWARAMFPGWVNDVDEVSVEIRYSV